MSSSSQSIAEWPKPLTTGAFGVLGELIEGLDGRSEADPAAVIWQLLAGVGTILGTRHYCQVDEDRHPPRLWVLLVGGTASRKGMSMGIAKSLLRSVDETWASSQIQSGLASGEALIESVRDPAPDRDDAGAPDNRLLVVEAEFSTLLRIARREGSTLSGILRAFYDDGNAQNRKVREAVVATGATVSVIGHITRPELTTEVRSVDVTNGLINRYALVACRRQGNHPEGGRLPEKVRKRVVSDLRESVSWAAAMPATEMKRDAEATDMWHDMYPGLTDRPESAYGYATGRGVAHTLRLSLLLALLDRQRQITTRHLEAAADLWRYADESARLVFGGSSGNRLTDRITRIIGDAGDAGISRTGLNRALSGNVRASELDALLGDLIASGQIVHVDEQVDARHKRSIYLPGPEASR